MTHNEIKRYVNYEMIKVLKDLLSKNKNEKVRIVIKNELDKLINENDEITKELENL